MKVHSHASQKSLKERLIHASSFELMAIILFSPLISVVMDRPLASTSTMTIILSSVAMVWNMIFTAIFEKAEHALGIQRSFLVRAIHACLFEGGLIVVLVPIIAWWMDLTLLDAFLLDIGLLILFLPYTMAFNWIYDLVRPG